MLQERVRVLFVEDDQDHAELVRGCFEEHHRGNELIHLPDGEAAMDYLQHRGRFADANQSPRPHLVLLDLRLPKIDGLEVLKQIKSDAALKSIPVVILTTSDADKDMRQAYRQNVNSYLVKPICYEKFCAMIRDLDSYWMMWNQQPGV